MIRRTILSLIVLSCMTYPLIAQAADPLCSNGTLAPGGNVCNCPSTATIGGSNFNPSSGSGFNGNTFNNMSFSGIGGALAGCANIGGLLSKLVNTVAGRIDSTVPVGDTATKASQAELEKANQREQCWNAAAYAVAHTSLQKVAEKTLNWVNTGFKGNPYYVRDIDSYLTSIKNEKLNSYLNGYVATSNPVFGNALRSVLKQQTTGWSDGLIDKSMNTPEGRAYRDFQDDFTQGGWNAFLNPQNNPIGAYFNATDQLSGIVNNAQQNVKDDLQQGNGFLSMRKCVEYEKPASATTSTSSITPAAPAKDLNCIRYEVVTPGQAISQQLSSITNSTVRQLENADSINEVLGSFFDQFMNRLFADGVTGSGNGRITNTAAGGFGTNTVVGANGQTLTGAASCQTPLGYDPATGGFNQEFDISRPQQLRAVIVSQKSYLTRAQDAQYIMNQLVPTIGALDYCIPGPNPSWNNNINENTQAFVSGLQQVIHKEGASAGYEVISHAEIIGNGAEGLFCTLNIGSCTTTYTLVGYLTKALALFDKTDGATKEISDRKYLVDENDTTDKIAKLFENTLKILKSRIENMYSEQRVTDAFLTTATTQAEIDNTRINIHDSYKMTSDLLGYNAGIQLYNEQYNTNIQNTQDAIAELEAIDEEVEAIVATAKANYINQMSAAGTPVNVSCLDNAYQLGTVGPGLPHLENITGVPNPMIQISKDSSTYFYSHL